MTKPPCQNIDVYFYQTRNALAWKARVVCGSQTFTIGPANIATVLNNVANLVRTEAAYADLQVYGPEAIGKALEPTAPQKEAQARRRERARKERADSERANETGASALADARQQQAEVLREAQRIADSAVVKPEPYEPPKIWFKGGV